MKWTQTNIYSPGDNMRSHIAILRQLAKQNLNTNKAYVAGKNGELVEAHSENEDLQPSTLKSAPAPATLTEETTFESNASATTDDSAETPQSKNSDQIKSDEESDKKTAGGGKFKKKNLSVKE